MAWKSAQRVRWISDSFVYAFIDELGSNDATAKRRIVRFTDAALLIRSSLKIRCMSIFSNQLSGGFNNVVRVVLAAALSCVASPLLFAATGPVSTIPPAPVATKPSAITAGRPQPVPIAFVYRDGANASAWTISHERARQAIAAEFGERIRTIAVENVATAVQADNVFDQLVARGYKVIFATDPVHASAAFKVAAADYDIKVEQAMGTQSLINLRTYEIRHVEQAYLAGVIAAGNSQSGKLGWIGMHESSAAIAELNAFTLGAQSVNPRATTQVIWAGSNADVATSNATDVRAAEALIAAGAEVLLSNTGSIAVARVAAQRGKRVIGWHADQSAAAQLQSRSQSQSPPPASTPSAHVATVAIDWTPFYITAIKESFDYLCTKSDTSRGYREGAIKLVGLSTATSTLAKTRLTQVQAALNRGEFEMLAGQSNLSANTYVRGAKAMRVRDVRRRTNPH
jgi:basic membrane protein A and related proteins